MHTIAAARHLKVEEDTDRRNDLDLPLTDNTSAGLAALLAANREFRKQPWPAPFDTTKHRLHLGDVRELGWIPDNSVELVVTSPPYWTLKNTKIGMDSSVKSSIMKIFLMNWTRSGATAHVFLLRVDASAAS
jgi:hypothetical protein